jgi:hypothetical protein
MLDLLFILCACYGLYCIGAPIWRSVVARRPGQRAHALTPTPRQLRPLEQWAFDFERDSLEVTCTSPEQKTRASYLLSQVVMPLVGHVRLCDVDRDIERGVASVLRAQTDLYYADYAAELWHGFLRWSRCQAGPLEESTVWEPLIAALEGRQSRDKE